MKKAAMLLAVLLGLSACAQPAASQNSKTTQEESLPMTQAVSDNTYIKKEGVNVIYLAGGCFWGIEKLMQSIPGVLSATSGYANGQEKVVPTYELVIGGETGYRETVQVEYDPNQISLDAILFAYFRVIDPTRENAQGADIGTQYQTGIYTVDEESKQIVERVVAVEKNRVKRFVVEVEPLTRFYEAEEYHQDYLDKNPGGYCHIPPSKMEAVKEMLVDPSIYLRPADKEIQQMLTPEQYQVTQQSGTEAPFSNEFWKHFERGIYVDIVTGEPLFTSDQKFDSSCGWPSFSAALDANALVHNYDYSYGMERVEVRSRVGDSHLGHVFYDEPESPNGVRYCINSASLRFVPYEQMEEEGYKELMQYIK